MLLYTESCEDLPRIVGSDTVGSGVDYCMRGQGDERGLNGSGRSIKGLLSGGSTTWMSGDDVATWERFGAAPRTAWTYTMHLCVFYDLLPQKFDEKQRKNRLRRGMVAHVPLPQS